MTAFIKRFDEICLLDLPDVGGKNASLGEMFSRLSASGINVPDGFASTAAAFWTFLDQNRLRGQTANLMNTLDHSSYRNLDETSLAIRQLILNAPIPEEVSLAITQAYNNLFPAGYEEVAVRSSATAEDLPEASFAGQHESFLNVRGESNLLQAVHRCFASLYTARAIKYREDHGFDHAKVALSVGVQKMVRSDMACSGVAFTLDPESGFRDVIHVSGVWGLGENIVQGEVTPDEFFIFKPTLLKGKKAIIQKKLGAKEKTMIYASPSQASNTTVNLDTTSDKRRQFILNDEEILQLARWSLEIEDHYRKPMDIEWAKDGITGTLYVIQARPETVQSRKNPYLLQEYQLLEHGQTLAKGNAIGAKLTTGKARILHSPNEAADLKNGEIIITDITTPDWDPILKKAAAIITNKGGRTSHASIVARELGVPAIVGTGNATTAISNGEEITVSCCEGEIGYVYRGRLKYKESLHDFSNSTMPEHTKPMLIIADPDQAFKLSFYPNDGVGLMRIEFIITHFIQAHPMALVKFDQLTDNDAIEKINALTQFYPDKKQYFIDKLAQGIATIAAAFYPKDVIVRMSDFKTNEYANLIGGSAFEPHEENPMLGFRGASRYYHELYKDGFRLECLALKMVREEMGLSNVKVMIPFCRTVEEGIKVVKVMSANGLNRDEDPSLQIYMMAEIPSNVLMADDFAKIFDGFSIGSNDLTQLTLGIDRDSAIVSHLFDEQNPAVKQIIAEMIQKAKTAKVKIGLCGQAPSDFPQFAKFLVEQGIDTISFNADALLQGIENIVTAEHQMAMHNV